MIFECDLILLLEKDLSYSWILSEFIIIEIKFGEFAGHIGRYESYKTKAIPN